jgi:hypothetical protein
MDRGSGTLRDAAGHFGRQVERARHERVGARKHLLHRLGRRHVVGGDRGRTDDRRGDGRRGKQDVAGARMYDIKWLWRTVSAGSSADLCIAKIAQIP